MQVSQYLSISCGVVVTLCSGATRSESILILSEVSCSSAAHSEPPSILNQMESNEASKDPGSRLRILLMVLPASSEESPEARKQCGQAWREGLGAPCWLLKQAQSPNEVVF